MKIIITERQLKKIILELEMTFSSEEEKKKYYDHKKELGITPPPKGFDPWEGDFIKTFTFGDNRSFFRVNLKYNHNDGHDLKIKLKERTRIKSLQQFNELLKESFPVIIPFLIEKRHDIWRYEENTSSTLGEKHSVIYENEYMKMVYHIKVIRLSKEEFVIKIYVHTILPYQSSSSERYEVKYDYYYPSSIPEMAYGIDYEDLLKINMKTYEEYYDEYTDEDGNVISYDEGLLSHEDVRSPRRGYIKEDKV